MWRALEKQPGVNIRVSIHIYSCLQREEHFIHFGWRLGGATFQYYPRQMWRRSTVLDEWCSWFVRAGTRIVFECTIAVLTAFTSPTMNSLWTAGHMEWISNSWGQFILIVLHSDNIFYSISPDHTHTHPSACTHFLTLSTVYFEGWTCFCFTWVILRTHCNHELDTLKGWLSVFEVGLHEGLSHCISQSLTVCMWRSAMSLLREGGRNRCSWSQRCSVAQGQQKNGF